MNEVSVPYEVLEKAEASEIQSQAEYVSSGEFLKEFMYSLMIMTIKKIYILGYS